MYKNYNSLGSGRDTWLKNGVGNDVGSSPTVSTKAARTSWLASLVLLVCCLLGGNSAMAQLAPAYNFGVSSVAFSSISGTGTSIPALSVDNARSNITGLPGFVVNGVTYTNAQASSNGWLVLYSGTAPTTSTEGSILNTAINNSAGGAVLFAPMNADLQGSPGTFYWQVVGSEIVFEWKNFSRFTGPDVLNFQIRLNTSTGNVVYSYGTCTQGLSTTNFTVGWKTTATTGSTNWATDVNNLSLDIVGSPTSCDWSNVVTGNSTTSTVYFNTANPGVKPASGLTYTWTKPATTQLPVRTFAAVSAITDNGATLAWTAPTGATTYNLQYRVAGTSCAWTNYASNPITGASVIVTGLAANTPYQIRVQAINGANTSIYSHTPSSASGSGTNGYTATGTFTTLPLACTGTPAPGTASPATASLCPGATQVFTVTGDTTGVSQLTYLWETSADGLTGWATAAGTATNASYTTAAYVSGTQYYRRKTTCTPSTFFDYSNVVSVVPPANPTVQITGLTATTATTTSITLSWTVGNGNNRSVYISDTNSFTNPVDGVSPGTAATAYVGPGQKLVFDGTGTTVTVTGLTLGTTYYFRAYESKKCTSPAYFYLTTGTSVALGTADRLKYTITRSVGTSSSYTPVSGAATILNTALNASSGTWDDTNLGAVSFFPFTYAGVTVSSFRPCVNGWMALNATNTNTSFNNGLTNTASNNFLLAPFWEDLFLNTSGQFVKYEITGSVGSRVLTVQWENVELFNYPGPSLNFQVKLYETTNVIEYRYGIMQGFDGTNPINASVTNGLAYNYTIGMNASTWATPALAGEAIGLQQANTLSFTSLGGVTNNEGINKLSVLPDCYSTYTFTPAGSIRANDPPASVPSPPTNDEPGSAVVLTPLATTPTDFCGSFYSSAFATASSVANPTLAAPIASTLADDDVWFRFTANSANTTVTVRGAGGYDAAMQIFSVSDLTSALFSKNANGLTGTSLSETIVPTAPDNFHTVSGQDYYVRVYHAGGGTQAIATATVVSGAITAITVNNAGAGYASCYGGAGVTATPFVYITDATGSGAVAKVTLSGSIIGSIAIQGSQGGSGYSATPTVTVAPPSFGVTGDFSIIVNATPTPPANDDITGAISLTPALTCSPTSGSTFTATSSTTPNVCGGVSDDDVWYSFVAPTANPVVSIQGTGSFNAVGQIFSSSDNTATGTLTQVACQGAGGAGLLNTISTSGLIPGNTYFVRVYHVLSGNGGGAFTICVTGTAPVCITSPTSPPNGGTACDSAPVTLSWPAGGITYDLDLDGTLHSGLITNSYPAGILTPGLHTWTVTPINALGSASGCSSWTFTVDPAAVAGTASGPSALVTGVSGSFSETGTGGNLQWKSATVSGGPYTNISGATTSPASFSFATAGTYYVVLVRTTTGCTPVTSNELTVVVTPPPGDDCSNPIALTLNTLVTTGNLATAGSNVSVTSCGFSTLGNEQYYTFTSGAAGTYILEITNTNGGFGFNDYFFKVASGAVDCALATGWTCIDDNSSVGTDTFTLAAATTYYLLVDAESSSSTANHEFRIIPPATCGIPTGLAVSDITAFTADLAWVAPTVGTGATYDWEIRTSGAGGSGATGLVTSGSTTAPTVTVNNAAGLTPATSYTVYVKTNCTGADGPSNWAGPASFTTLATCGVPTAITLSDLTLTTLDIAWTAPTLGTAANYNWEVRTSGAGGSGATGLVTSGTTSSTSLNDLALTTDTVYTFFVQTVCTGVDGSSNWAGPTTFALSAGESCTTAITIPVAANLGAATDTTLTSGFTSDGPNGTCSNATGNPSKKDRWVKFVAPSSGNSVVITTTSGTISDCVMQVWESCPAVDGNALGCSDDVNSLMPELSFCSLTPGATYWVQIWPWSATATGDFSVAIYEDTVCPPAPDNDQCAGAVVLTVGADGTCATNAVSGTTVNARPSAGVVKTTCDPFATYYDVFYKFNSGSETSLNYTFTSTGASTQTFGLYKSCGTVYSSVCNDSSILGTTGTFTGLTTNTDYYIIVYSTTIAAQDTFDLCVTKLPVVPSTAPTSLTSDAVDNTVCGTSNVVFTVGGGSLGTGASWKLYKGGCGTENGGTFVASSATATFAAVSVSASDTYYVRAESTNPEGNTTTCASLGITVGTLTTWYFDNDGDGFGSTIPADIQITCSDLSSTGYITVGNDCDDSDPAIHAPFTPTVSIASDDADNSFCSGTSVTFTATPGTLSGLNDGDYYLTGPVVVTYDFKVNGSTVQSSTSDTYTTTTLTNGQIVSVAISVSGGTCRTQDTASSTGITNTVGVIPTWYLDVDGDGYYSGAGQTQCTSPGAGWTTTALAGDCDDTVIGQLGVPGNQINPGHAEVCWNNVNDNCNSSGTLLSEGCTPVVVNMNASYNNTTLLSLATAIPAVPYTYPGTSNIKYRFTVTNTTTGASVADIIQTSRFVNIPGSLYSSPGTFTITASAVINDEVVPYAGNTITVFGPTIPKITLAPTSCGATLATLTSTLTANQGQNATGYTFRIRDIGGSTYFTSSSSTRFVNANSFAGFPLSYSTSYLVSVQYSYTDPVTLLSTDSGYGTECTITTPGIPTISMASPTCGSTVAALNAGITATSAANATSYQFRIRLTSNVGGPYTEATPTASRFSSLTAFGTLQYNSSYSVSVRYSIGAQWSLYGPECIINTPNLPTTQLVPSQCGQVAATPLTQQLNIVAYPGFPSYRVKLTEVIGEDLGVPQEIVIPYSYFRLNQFSTAQNGKVYNIEVAIKTGGVFGPYSTVCDVHTPAIAKGVKVPFKAVAYPNPFANNFMLDVKTTSESLVSLKVYDMVGRLIDTRNVSVSDLETTTIGDRYPAGVYNVVVSQEDSVETVRVIKR